MYLGGNGFYQVTARHPGHPDAIEIRRGHAGVATWVSDPGEENLSATGEPGGLWRMRGRAPNVLAGVGFTAQGFDKGSGYARSEASADPSVSWVFDGVKAGVGEVFGAEGPGLGGAAGDELDRADITLGTPADAVVLASSVGHSEQISLVPEEIDHSYAAPPPGIHPKVRADVVLFGRPGGGAVFSVGSIAWSTAMTHAGGDNDTARVTGNVLDRFRDAPGPVIGRPWRTRPSGPWRRAAARAGVLLRGAARRPLLLPAAPRPSGSPASVTNQQGDAVSRST
jgi:N,N-dimethylformamidase